MGEIWALVVSARSQLAGPHRPCSLLSSLSFLCILCLLGWTWPSLWDSLSCR
jgi:hypothetical protein